MQPDHQAILDQYLEYAQRCKTAECADRGAEQTRRQLNGHRESIRIASEFSREVLEPVIGAFEKRAKELREAED